jgi:hypothetical protein
MWNMVGQLAHIKGVRVTVKQPNDERLTVRIPADLLESIKKAADESGWGVADQVRFELMYLRGMWKPSLPKPTDSTRGALQYHSALS